ncbi:hypothetical protein LC605_24945 [Nostoc sp. CHAB 5836]|nr:hypothetical protein [Nostoc sp. CHAB 5836]
MAIRSPTTIQTKPASTGLDFLKLSTKGEQLREFTASLLLESKEPWAIQAEIISHNSSFYVFISINTNK